MLAEFVNRLQQLSDAAMRPYMIELDVNDKRTAYVFNPATKAIQGIALQAAPREHHVLSLQSLKDAFDRYGEGYTPSVWVDMDGVQIILDDENLRSEENTSDERKHSITLSVTPSPLFDALIQIPCDQKALVYFLRHTLHGAVVTPENFQLAVSSLRWQIVDTSVGQFGTLNSKMGKDITAEVTPGGELPLEVGVSFLPFPALEDEGIDEEVQVVCSVHVEPEKKTISVKPFPGQMERARVKAVGMLVEKVAELLGEGVDVFAGTP